MLRIICFILIFTGGVVTLVSAVRYRKMIRFYQDESYYETTGSQTIQLLSQLSLVFFLFGFVVGLVDVIRRDVEPIYLFIGFVFFIGGLYIDLMTRAQISMTTSLRKKTFEVLRAFINTIELKDCYTKSHSLHVYQIVGLIYEALPQAMRRDINLPKLLDASMLHDLGKLGISDEIINKQTPLTPEEWVKIKTHPEIGAKLLSDTCFQEISNWVLYHHERIDGKGYHGLNGEEIPLESRIIAVADTYSAITTGRVYREKISHEEALSVLRDVKGTQLDKTLVEYFCTISKETLEGLHTGLY